MDFKDSSEHPVALKVMRLTRPTFISPQIVTCDAKDLPGNLLNNYLKDDIVAVKGMETMAAGQFLLVPQSFGNIYLGETFSCYLCVHNETRQIVKDVSVKADLQTSSQHIPLSTHQSRSVCAALGPDDTVNDVIHHEVKDLGTHILMCEISYLTSLNTMASFRKFFKFQVMKPLDVKTKFYNVGSDEVYLEAHIQNITSGPICLEKVSLDSSQLFKATSLNMVDGDKSVFGDMNLLQPQASCQYLYCLAPQTALAADLKQLAATRNMGKLDIVWRSNLGERGRLQTSQLQRMPPDCGDIRLTFESLPSKVLLEVAFDFKCKIINTSERQMELILKLKSTETAGLLWAGVSDRKIGNLEPGATTILSLCAFPISAGLQTITGISLVDNFLKRTYDYDDIASVFVTQFF
ncbi:trafficking protein particle complex subunit 13 [Arctopsyche grandis]|uniref:trafficking protein particle complex subunit 13 n=1 Tax=Arctopsyche grandis TaxID=121162 RepID=UPI00406D6B6F